MSTVEQDQTGRKGPSRSEADAARALARQVGLEYVDLDRYPVNGAATGMLPEPVARRYHALAIGWKYGTPVVAVATPDNFLAMDDVRTAVGQDLHAVVVAQSQIDAFIEHAYAKAPANAVKGSGHSSKEPATAAAPAGRRRRTGAAESPVPRPPTGPDADGRAAPVTSSRRATPGRLPTEVPASPMAATLPLRPSVTPSRAPVMPSEPPRLGGRGAESGGRSRADAAEHRLTRWRSCTRSRLRASAEAREPPEAPGRRRSRRWPRSSSHRDWSPTEEMAAALRESAATGRSLGVILKELGLVSEEDLIRWMADEAGLEFVDLNDFPIDSRAINLLPETMARRHQLLAIGFRGDHPIVAMANPSNVFALDDLRTVLGGGVETVVSSPRQITDYISRMYRHDKEAADAARSAVANQSAAEVSATTLDHRPARCRRGRADHQVRQPDPPPGPAGAGIRRPRRAGRRRPPCPLPDRRCAARHHPSHRSRSKAG